MAKKIVWTDYLTEEAIFRFWYILENNNFKSAIKKAQKKAKMNYAIMHNALYSGLYFPKNDYIYGKRVIKDIRANKNMPKNSAVANYMSREEILKNIHAMFESANIIRTYAPYGYNAKLFAEEFNKIGKQETKKTLHEKIFPMLYNMAQRNDDESVLNKPNRYRLAKTFEKSMKNKVEKYYFSTEKERQSKYDKALSQYKNAKQKLIVSLQKNNLQSLQDIEKLLEYLDEGLYRSIIAQVGFSIDNIIDEKNLISTSELKLHTQKFKSALNVSVNMKNATTSELEKMFKECGESVRNNYIIEERKYPECNKGFINAFCHMLSKAYEHALNEKIKTDDTIIEIFKQLSVSIEKLEKQYNQSNNEKDKKEIEVQVKKIKDALEQSNELNI